jgi:arylsulfatase A-like enzyme/thioredoxin-like negative regulator of GroEL
MGPSRRFGGFRRSSRRALAVLCLTAGPVAACGGGAPVARGPVVLVSIDTLRADRLPVYGYARGRTPALDGFARDAVVFDRAYSHAPQTLPSHASMFTGRLPFEHAVRDNLGFTLAPGAVTLAGEFKRAGYRTAGFVSAYVLRAETGIAQGFDTFDATFPASSGDRSPAQVQRAGPDTLAAAEAWLRAQANSQFFLFFHIYEPHKPYRAPDRFAGPDAYDGEVAFADEIVGRLFALLQSRQWYNDATIVVMSDHGEGLGDHIEEEHGLFLYEEVVRVPWIMKLPGRRSAGQRVRAPIQHIDLLPTLLAQHALPAVSGLRGRDLSPVLTDPARGAIAAQGIYAEALYPRYHFNWSELQSLTDDRFKYIKAPREELYDLERDPAERSNLAGDRTQAAAALRSALDALAGGREVDRPSAVSDADRQRLAALGYVGSSTAATTKSGETRPDPKDKAPLLRTYRQAVERLGDGRTAEGAEMLARILEEDPAMTDVWSQYGAALVRLRRHQDALEAYKQMIRLQPDEPNGALGAASVLLTLNRLPEARSHAELAIRRAPAQAHQALALIEVAAGRRDEALRHATLAAEAEPGLPMPAFVRGALAYHAQRYAEALPALMEARTGFRKRSTQPRDLHFMVGDSLARLEKYAEAEQYLVEEAQLYPDHVRARASLAMLYQSMGRTAQAEETLDRLVRQVPTQESFETVARVWRMFGRAERAAEVDRLAGSLRRAPPAAPARGAK